MMSVVSVMVMALMKVLVTVQGMWLTVLATAAVQQL